MLFILWAATPAALAQEPALLRGRVRAEPKVRPKALSDAEVYADRDLHLARRFDYKRLKDVVVYAESVAGGETPPTEHYREEVPPPKAVGERPPTRPGASVAVTVKKRWGGLRLQPGFLAVAVGSEALLENQTSEPVTLYAGGGSAGPFAVELGPHEARPARLQAAGLYRLFCLEDQKASARVLVAGSNLALADADGNYSLTLPAGRYRVSAWHERLPPQTREISVGPGEKLQLDFTLSVAQLPEVP